MPIDLPLEELNTRVKLIAPRGWNSYKLGDVVSIAIQVTSEDAISFSYADIKLYFINGGIWTEIDNLFVYQGEYIVVQPLEGNPFNTADLGILPDIQNYEDSTTLRIILIGNIIRNNQVTDDITGAYIDVVLNP
jgi:hypothetical protein